MSLTIGVCTLHLILPGAGSLKQKRGRLKPLLHQLRRRFNVAAAEVGAQDVWQTAEVAIVAVANDSAHVYAVLEKAVHWVEDTAREVQVYDWEVELR